MFYLTITLMISVAIATLIMPILRSTAHQIPARRILTWVIAISCILPMATIVLYRYVGNPKAAEYPKPSHQPRMNISQAITRLRAHLTSNPDDARGWRLMAQASRATHHMHAARDAYAHVLTLLPKDTSALLGWIETDILLHHDHRIHQHALNLIRHLLKQDPDNPRALWLLGVQYFEAGRFTLAAKTWHLLQTQLSPDSTIQPIISKQIKLATRQARDKHVMPVTSLPEVPHLP